MSLSSIISISITRESTGVSQAGFGVPLILSYHTVFPERYREYTNAQAMVNDGFAEANAATGAVADPALVAARRLFQQSPGVQKVVVGRADTLPAMTVVFTPKAPLQANTEYAIKINGQTATYTTDATPLASEITNNLSLAINALIGAGTQFNATDTGPGTSITIDDATSASGTFEYEPVDLSLWTINETTADPSSAASLTAVNNATSEWFMLIPTGTGTAEITALAAALPTERMMMVSTADTASLTASTGLASTLKAAGYDSVGLLFSPQPRTQPAAAWAGRMLSTTPGSATWKFKTLTGTSTYKLTTTQESGLETNNGNHYQVVGGVGITQQGKAASGEFLDVTRFTYWLQSRLREQILSLFVRVNKVPFTDAGIAVVESAIRSVLQTGINNGGLAGDPEPVVSVPRAADVSAVDKANRVLPDILFTATLAGAVHSTVIQGTVSV